MFGKWQLREGRSIDLPTSLTTCGQSLVDGYQTKAQDAKDPEGPHPLFPSSCSDLLAEGQKSLCDGVVSIVRACVRLFLVYKKKSTVFIRFYQTCSVCLY
ncbi:hypothetical protein DPMN_058151 [Dreissena polymorpha]|uniref:Uncharacterized protein n=1 Tax=Dreissena polymorpha TaxID=45954 RepID=A0A9D4C1H8_DREPO|nr:hypothetical protein DPMN_058151 [Dreissena polymorpha]